MRPSSSKSIKHRRLRAAINDSIKAQKARSCKQNPMRSNSKENKNMKTIILLQIAAALTLAVASMPVVNMEKMSVKNRENQLVDAKFQHYRQAIREAYQIDLKGFKDTLRGGMADGKAVTTYDLEELLAGINFEMEHTNDKLIALEIAMDHLERIPDYYSRLRRLEREASADRLLEM
jgi:hypothetical protein